MLLFLQATSHVTVDVAGFFVPNGEARSDGRFVTDTPTRLVDSRPGETSGPFTRVPDGAGSRVTVDVLGRGGVPASADEVDAVVVVVTGINNSGGGGGFVTPYATGSSRPTVSAVNVGPTTDVRANLAVVPVRASGSIELYLEGVDHVAVDLAGYVTGSGAASSAEGLFHLLTPARNADSRIGLGLDPLAVGQPQTLNPPSIFDGASSVAQNVTMVRTGGSGFVTAYPGPSVPGTSTVNASGAGQVRGAFNITRMSSGTRAESGSVTYRAGESSTGITVDVFGWFE